MLNQQSALIALNAILHGSIKDEIDENTTIVMETMVFLKYI
jgi:hypothetical protein